MTPFTSLTSVVAPILRDNIDTDTIIPSREITSTGRTGLADGLFAPWRYLEGRVPDPDFALNRMPDARVIAGGANFGCGSSREHAVWALAEFGIRAVIAESFSPIFRGNCVRNGVLPIELGRPVWPEVIGECVTIDLANQHVQVGDRFRLFYIDPEAKTMLLEGLDAIDLTLKYACAITAFHKRDRVARPWVYL